MDKLGNQINMAIQQTLAISFAEEADCWFDGGLDGLDVLDALASTGLSLVVSEDETDETLIQLMAEELDACGQEIDFSEMDNDPKFQKLERNNKGEIADALRMSLSTGTFGLVTSTSDKLQSLTYYATIKDSLEE